MRGYLIINKSLPGDVALMYTSSDLYLHNVAIQIVLKLLYSDKQEIYDSMMQTEFNYAKKQL